MRAFIRSALVQVLYKVIKMEVMPSLYIVNRRVECMCYVFGAVKLSVIYDAYVIMFGSFCVGCVMSCHFAPQINSPSQHYIKNFTYI